MGGSCPKKPLSSPRVLAKHLLKAMLVGKNHRISAQIVQGSLTDGEVTRWCHQG